jgi:hypothetical protein
MNTDTSLQAINLPPEAHRLNGKKPGNTGLYIPPVQTEPEAPDHETKKISLSIAHGGQLFFY